MLSNFRTQAVETRKSFRGLHRGGLQRWFCVISTNPIIFIGELPVSKLPTYEYRMVQYRLWTINMQKIEKLRWKNFVYVQDSFLLFLAHTDQ